MLLSILMDMSLAVMGAGIGAGLVAIGAGIGICLLYTSDAADE